jgi:hypothetical protein
MDADRPELKALPTADHTDAARQAPSRRILSGLPIMAATLKLTKQSEIWGEDPSELRSATGATIPKSGGGAPKAPFDMPKMNWKLTGHVDTVTVTFQGDRLVHVELDAGEIDGLLRNLSELRAIMQPPHPFDFTRNADTNFIVDPRWGYGHEPSLGQSVLRIRDPRFGWLHYVISEDTARKLADALNSPGDLPSGTLN